MNVSSLRASVRGGTLRGNRGPAIDLANAIARGEDTHRGVCSRDAIAAIDDAIADLTKTREHITDALVRAHRDVDDNLGSGSYDEVRAPGISDPTARRGQAAADRSSEEREPADIIRKTADKLIDSVAAARAMASQARATVLQLLPLSPERAREALGDGPAYCANCAIPVWRTPRDRLLSGRCRPCHDYRKAHDGEERPRDLWT